MPRTGCAGLSGDSTVVTEGRSVQDGHFRGVQGSAADLPGGARGSACTTRGRPVAWCAPAGARGRPDPARRLACHETEGGGVAAGGIVGAAEDDEGHRNLAELRVVPSDDRRRGDHGVRADDLFDLPGEDLLAAPVDHVIGPRHRGRRYPSASRCPRSPVRSQPSWSKRSRCASPTYPAITEGPRISTWPVWPVSASTRRRPAPPGRRSAAPPRPAPRPSPGAAGPRAGAR